MKATFFRTELKRVHFSIAGCHSERKLLPLEEGFTKYRTY
ncbi:hypothetical protein HMPREF0083_02283 [Aneurinibacillus aneurinilyticus ATCC 12856]|uniref:Uncharacterized protein n=1 Tax=Aneurinibacillus aneurinilyticus ATCC 12856 TaxID=649747 RepID=U1X3L7_ANEAE|nr:hypothetical protein HMPREF0083_02283 [Aneurinibacillus aneurinilyticus ATCC 12856]